VMKKDKAGLGAHQPVPWKRSGTNAERGVQSVEETLAHGQRTIYSRDIVFAPVPSFIY
jgi:hypothetical protein